MVLQVRRNLLHGPGLPWNAWPSPLASSSVPKPSRTVTLMCWQQPQDRTAPVGMSGRGAYKATAHSLATDLPKPQGVTYRVIVGCHHRNNIIPTSETPQTSLHAAYWLCPLLGYFFSYIFCGQDYLSRE